MKKQMLTTKQAAIELNVSEKTIHRMIRQGKVDASKIGSGQGQWRLSLDKCGQNRTNIDKTYRQGCI